MPQFVVRNDKLNPIDVVIEPWAGVAKLAPKTVVLFDYDEPAEISIATEENGDLFVTIISERLRWVADAFEIELSL